MNKITTVQMVQWLSSVSTNQCQMCALVQIPPGANFFPSFFSIASDAGKIVYIDVSCYCNISEFKFSMGCVQIINIAKPPNLLYQHQKHPMADTLYVGPRARMSTCTCPKSLSDIIH